MWTVKLSELNCRWVEGRVPRIDAERLKALSAHGYAPTCSSTAMENETKIVNFRRVSKTSKNLYFRYPAGVRGIGEIWRRFASTFPDELFRYNRKVVQIDTNKKLVILTLKIHTFQDPYSRWISKQVRNPLRCDHFDDPHYGAWTSFKAMSGDSFEVVQSKKLRLSKPKFR